MKISRLVGKSGLQVLAGALVCGLISAASAQDVALQTLPQVFLIGDSTVKNGTAGLQGWGDPFIGLFDTKKAMVINRARGGRSSRTYFTEGLWNEVLKQLKPGDWVLMQFGHNDGGGPHDARGRGSIKGNGDETVEAKNAEGKTETVHSYGWYLRRYITDAQSKGATPLVLSPIPRNRWSDAGKVLRSGGDYGLWAKQAAEKVNAELAAQTPVPNVPRARFMDLNSLVSDRYDTMGKEKVAPLFGTDWTHTNPTGAQLNAHIVAAGIKELPDCALKNFLLP